MTDTETPTTEELHSLLVDIYNHGGFSLEELLMHEAVLELLKEDHRDGLRQSPLPAPAAPSVGK